MRPLLTFWKSNQTHTLSDAEIHDILLRDEDVEGLVDLPIKEIIDRIKHAFPGVVEEAGALQWKHEPDAFRATWTWQFLRIEAEQLTDEYVDTLLAIAREFNCVAYNAKLGMLLGG